MKYYSRNTTVFLISVKLFKGTQGQLDSAHFPLRMWLEFADGISKLLLVLVKFALFIVTFFVYVPIHKNALTTWTGSLEYKSYVSKIQQPRIMSKIKKGGSPMQVLIRYKYVYSGTGKAMS